MPPWAWLVLGVGAFAVEMFVIDAQFYLVFLGAAAAIVGLLAVVIPIPDSVQWLIFAALSIITMLTFRQRLYRLVRERSGHVEERLTLGDQVRVPVRLEAGESCRVEYKGSSWTARNCGEQAIDAGHDAHITRVDGLTLELKAGSR
jgi:membrane protein implicated in regulation of membrane protease activity